MERAAEGGRSLCRPGIQLELPAGPVVKWLQPRGEQAGKGVGGWAAILPPSLQQAVGPGVW